MRRRNIICILLIFLVMGILPRHLNIAVFSMTSEIGNGTTDQSPSIIGGPRIFMEAAGSSGYNVTLSNMSIDFVYMYRETSAEMKNVTINYLYLFEETSVVVYNSTIDYIYIADLGKAFFRNVTIGDVYIYDLAEFSIVNCTVDSLLAVEDYSTVSIRDSDINQIYDYGSKSLVINRTAISEYHVTEEYPDVPVNTHIINSSIKTYIAEVSDIKDFDIPVIYLEHTNITQFNGTIIYQGPGEIDENETVSGLWNYTLFMDDYTEKSIELVAPLSYVFYGDWYLDNMTIQDSVETIFFIDGSFELAQTNFTASVYGYDCSINIDNTTLYFDQMMLWEVNMSAVDSQVNGSITAYYSTVIINGSYFEKFSVYSDVSLSFYDGSANYIYYNPSGDGALLNLHNITVETLTIYHDSVNLDSVNVTSELKAYAYIVDSNITNVNTTLLRTYMWVYDDCNMTDKGIDYVLGATQITFPNVTYGSLIFGQIYVYGGTFYLANFSDFDTFVYVNGAELIMENVSLTYRLSLFQSTGNITNSTITVSSWSRFYIDKSTVNISDSTVKWGYFKDSTIYVNNSVFSSSTMIYDSHLLANYTALATDPGAALVLYNSEIRFINVSVGNTLKTTLLSDGVHDIIASYLTNVTIGGTYYETILVNGSSSATLDNTGFSGLYYNSTQSAVNVVYSSKGYYLYVYDDSTLKLFNITTGSEYNYVGLFDDSVMILENATTSLQLVAHDNSRIMLNNSAITNLEVYDYVFVNSTSSFKSSVYNTLARGHSNLTLSNISILQSMTLYEYSFINLTNPFFVSGNPSISFRGHSSGLVVCDSYSSSNKLYRLSIDSSSVRNVYIKNMGIMQFTGYAFVNLTIENSEISTYYNKISIPTVNITELDALKTTIKDTNIMTFYDYLGYIPEQGVINSSGIYSLSGIPYDYVFENCNIGTFARNRTMALVNGSLYGYNASVYAIYLYIGSVSPVPNILAADTSIEMEEGMDRIIRWQIIDYSPHRYYVYENGTKIKDVSYSTHELVEIGLSTYPAGFYNFTILADNNYDNSNASTIFVTIHPSVAPNFLSTPNNKTFESGLSTQLFWNASDLFPFTYSVYINGTEEETGAWYNSSAVVYNFSKVDAATYNVTAVFRDEAGNYNDTTCFVKVLPAVAPVVQFLNGTDQITIYDNETILLAWTAEDATPYQYSILVNGSVKETNTWSSNEIISYLFSGTEGVYNITIVFSDKLDHKTSNTVVLTILSSSAGQEPGEEEQPPPDNTWLIIVIVVIIVVAGVAVVLFKSKKKKTV